MTAVTGGMTGATGVPDRDCSDKTDTYVDAARRLRHGAAIVIAQRAGETDEEIVRVTGYTVPMIRAVLSSS